MKINACWAGSRLLEDDSAWKLMRTSVRERDMTLAPEAVAWLAQLPWTIRPQELCLRYPRVANRMSLLWPDPHLTGLYFGALLTDKRGGRRGFATRITEELMALRSYYAELRGMAIAHDATRRRLMEELQAVLSRHVEEAALAA